MEFIIKISIFIFLTFIVINPILVIWYLNKKNFKHKFLLFITITIITSLLLILILAWWDDKSNEILLHHYGYNFDAMSETEYYQNVSPENLKEVKKLEYNNMGIGWPIIALIAFMYNFPYLLIIYLGNYFISNLRKAKKAK